MHQGLVPFPHSLALLLEQFGTGLGGLFATPLVPIGKYVAVLPTVCGLFLHTPHIGEPIELAVEAGEPQAGQQTQTP